MKNELVYSIWREESKSYIDFGLSPINRFDVNQMIKLADTLHAMSHDTYYVEQFYTYMPNVPGKIIYTTIE